ncbi:MULTISPECIES: ABC transporter permease [unclassified Thiobacillus]|uniref:ABC transporter permease n=1 Tax=unclassified Thiobacillus TaxID=2646513 RepID=UPI00086B966C|nr:MULTISPECIES: ABC transporter permease [unclassified Thiobacillus]MBN8779236.1 ABC transporter permease [Thiobacillus sp.]ODU99907.1 MAG: ABC transporter permease [Thiobacillus sp. SCN 63-57]
MINLAGRDIVHHLKSYLLTGLGLGLLIGVTLTMAGVYRGMVDDAKVLLRAVDADVWVVQQDTLGPFAEPSSVPDDLYRALLGLPGVAQAGNVAYLTMQVSHAGRSQRVMVAGFEPGKPGGPAFLVAGRPIARAHYEAVADAKTGLRVGDVVRIRRNDYTVVGLTRRMVSSNGDPMLFIPLKDAQEAQFLKDNDAIVEDRQRLAANPAINRPGQPGVLDAVQEIQTSSHKVNAVLLRLQHGADARAVADTIARWQRFTAYTRDDMEEILVAKLIATAAKQIGLFLMILAVVSAAIVAFIIYTMTLGKIKEIAVLKLIGTRNRTIAAMIMQEALGLGIIGFLVGKFAATLWAPAFPKYVLLETGDAGRAFVLTLVVCALASVLAIRAALRIDPAEAIGG